MHIKSLEIKNYKAIKYISLDNLSNMIVIAGPNGCGKSCIFEAIRCIKSHYGGYSSNEQNQFYEELKLKRKNNAYDLTPLFQDKTKSLEISLEIVLADSEKEFISKYYRSLLVDYYRDRDVSILYSDDFESRIKDRKKKIDKGLALNSLIGKITITKEQKIELLENSFMHFVFSIIAIGKIGFIDYHGPNRDYKKENLNQINLIDESSVQKLKQNALYNYENKYNNIKQEMASSYIKELIRKDAGEKIDDKESTISTLKKLFDYFIGGVILLVQQAY